MSDNDSSGTPATSPEALAASLRCPTIVMIHSTQHEEGTIRVSVHEEQEYSRKGYRRATYEEAGQAPSADQVANGGTKPIPGGFDPA